MDVQRVLQTCIQCRRHNAANSANIPLRPLPKIWPKKVVALSFFGFAKNKGKLYFFFCINKTISRVELNS